MLAVYLLFSVACFFTVHEHWRRIVMAVTHHFQILAVSGNGVSDTVPSTAAAGSGERPVKTRAAPLPSAAPHPALCC